MRRAEVTRRPEQRALPFRRRARAGPGSMRGTGSRCATARPAHPAASRCSRRAYFEATYALMSLLHPCARREPRSRIRESRLQSVEIARMVDVNERAEARHDYRCVERNRDRCVGRGLRRRGLAVAVGDRLLAVAWALAQGQGGLPGGANSSGLPKSPAAAISERRRSTPSDVRRCSRKPVDRGFAAPGTSRLPAPDQPPVGVHPRSASSELPVWASRPRRRSRALRWPGCSASLL